MGIFEAPVSSLPLATTGRASVYRGWPHLGRSPIVIPMLPADADTRLHRFLAHWTSLAGGRPYPSRADLDPVAIPDLLPLVFLVDVVAGPPLDFAYRLLGSDVVANTPRSYTGRRLSEIANEGSQHNLIVLYREALAARQPRFRLLDYRTRRGTPGRYQVLVAPLGNGEITQLAGIAVHRLGEFQR